MRPWEMERLTREEVFELYLEPERPDDGPTTAPTHREQAFCSLQAGGMSWLQAEREYQRWRREQ